MMANGGKLSDELFSYGKILKVNNFTTPKGYYTIRIFCYEGKVYFHKMLNGVVVEIKLIGKEC